METQSFFKILGALGVAFSLTLAACGVKDTNIGAQDFAVAGADCSPVGSNLPSEDGCNTCQCTADGTWACTLRACEVACDLGDQKLADDGCNTCTCTEDGSWACTERACGPAPECDPGTTRPAADGCNSCGCTDDGHWACTLIDCAPEPVCDLGSERPSDDGCNTCTCTGSGWACTDRACEPLPTTCTPGAQRPSDDGCNTCTCSDSGDWLCTERGCAPTACKPGEQQPSSDGCNTCACLDSGDWACTLKACPEVCTPGDSKKLDCNSCFCDEAGNWACTLIDCNQCPGPTTSAPEELCATVTTWAQDPTSGNCCQYGTPCSAPVGWKQFGTAEACEKAPVCPVVTTRFAPEVCAAVIVWAKDPESGGCCQYPDPCSAPEGWEQFYTPTECAGTE